MSYFSLSLMLLQGWSRAATNTHESFVFVTATLVWSRFVAHITIIVSSHLTKLNVGTHILKFSIHTKEFLFYPLWQDNEAGIAQSSQWRATGWMIQESGFDSRQPPIQLVLRTLSLGLKRPSCVTGHSPPSSTEAKNGRAIPSLLHTPLRRSG
jgi:hypothetical protein